MPAHDPEASIYELTATTAQLEECFGVTKQYLGQLEKSGDIRKSARNRWNFFETVQQFVDLLKNRKVNQHDSGEGVNLAEVAVNYERDKARKMKADADIAEIIADLMAGRVHEGKAVEELWTMQAMAARSKFLATPSKLAALLPPDIAAAFLKDATDLIHEVLEQLGDYDAQKIAERTDKKRVADPAPTADDAPLASSAEIEPESVGG